MKKTSIYASLLIASGAFLLSHLSNPSIGRQVEAGVSHWTCKNTFSIVEEDGEEIYKKTGNLATIANLQYDYDFVYGSISFDARIDDANNLTSNYLGISLVNSSSKYWALRGQYKQTLVDFIYNNGSVDKEYKSATGSFNPTKGSWASFKYEYTPTKLSFSMNGSAIYTLTTGLDDASMFSLNTLSIDVRGLNVSIKNIKVVDDGDMTDLGWSVPSTFTEAYEDGGELVYTHIGESSQIKKNGKNFGKYNYVSGDVRVNSIGSESDCNCGFLIHLDSSGYNFYFFEYNPAPGSSYARLRLFNRDNSVHGIGLELKKIEIAPLDEWVNLKAVFDEDYLLFYINDQLIISHYDTEGIEINAGVPHFHTWLTGCSVKNLTTGKVDVDYSTVSLCDFEFNKARSVDAFSIDNGEKRLEDGQLKVNVTGDNPELTSPILDVSEYSRYSAKLCVRNTILIRLKNSTSASSLTFSFIMKHDQTYDANKQKTIEISPNSDYQTYFINLSDVYDCGHAFDRDQLWNCDDYLWGFKIRLNGAQASQSFDIDAISFQMESRIYEKAASSYSCIANKDENTFTFSGKALDKYKNKNIRLWMTYSSNYLNQLTYPMNVLLGETLIDQNGNFSITVPLKYQNRTHLSSFFLADIEGHLIDDKFKIENYYDFSENPYHFEVASYQVNVTSSPYSAKGDAFSNDTKAIQQAIEDVASHGGGKVIIPGDINNPYGRRYVISNLFIRSNVEVVLEKGAILWQSERVEDYDWGYAPFIDHNIYIPSVPWTHAATSWNLPFIFFDHASHAKLTGGGMLRMQDTGSNWIDGNSFWGSSPIGFDDPNIIHMDPVGIADSHYIEFKDIDITRSNMWHMFLSNSSHVYFGNVDMYEVGCVNGDGIDSSCGTHDVVIDNCSLYSNDDAIVIGAVRDDPRGQKDKVEHVWWHNTPEGTPNGAYNFTVINSHMYGGHGITIINWGSDNPNEEIGEIHDVIVTGCVLGGTLSSVGAWSDNPFYGDSCLDTFTQRENDDYSPVRDFYVVGNEYLSPCYLTTWPDFIQDTFPVTNFISDCGLHSEPDFLNGDFDKHPRYSTEVNWQSGLSYWSREVGENGEVGTIKVGNKQSEARKDDNILTEVGDYNGYIKGNASLYQGLYEDMGAYKVSMDAHLVSGEATLFVRNSLSKRIIASQKIDVSSSMNKIEMPFNIYSSMDIEVGVKLEGSAEDVIYLDNASIEEIPMGEDFFHVKGETHEFNFIYDSDLFDLEGMDISNGKLTVEGSGTALIKDNDDLGDYELDFDISLNDGVNGGILLLAKEGEGGEIEGYRLRIRKNAFDSCELTLFKVEEDGSLTRLSGTVAMLKDNDKLSIKIKLIQNALFLYANYQSDDNYLLTYALDSSLDGGLGFYSLSSTEFSNVSLKSESYEEPIGDKTKLNQLIQEADALDSSTYSSSTWQAFQEALNKAKEVEDGAKASVVGKAYYDLSEAMASLRTTTYENAKEALEKEIDKAKNINPSAYEEKSYEAYMEAVSKAEEVFNNPSATEDELKQAKASIEKAKAKLKKKNDGKNGNIVLPIVLVGVGVLLIAGAAAFIFIKKKKAK